MVFKEIHCKVFNMGLRVGRIKITLRKEDDESVMEEKACCKLKST